MSFLKNESVLEYINTDKIQKRWRREEMWDKIKLSGKVLGFFVAACIVLAFLGGGLSKQYESKCKEFLQNQRYENIKVVGWDPISENKGDITSMKFEATNENGKNVKGVVIVGGSVLFGETYQVKFK